MNLTNQERDSEHRRAHRAIAEVISRCISELGHIEFVTQHRIARDAGANWRTAAELAGRIIVHPTDACTGLDYDGLERMRTGLEKAERELSTLAIESGVFDNPIDYDAVEVCACEMCEGRVP